MSESVPPSSLPEPPPPPTPPAAPPPPPGSIPPSSSTAATPPTSPGPSPLAPASLASFRHGLGPVVFGGVWREAWGLVQKNYGLLVGATLVAGVLGWLAGMVLGLVPIIGNSIAQIFLQTPLQAGCLLMGLRLARGDTAMFGQVWAGFTRYREVIIVGATQALGMLALTLLPMSFGVLVQRNNATSLPFGIILGVLGFLVLAGYIILGTRLWLAMTLVMDDRLGPPTGRQAVVASWDLSRKLFWPLLGQGVLVYLLAFICLLVLVLPVFLVALPWAVMVNAVMYRRIMGAMRGDICRGCGYTLAGTTGTVCPECGMAKV